MIVGVLGGGQLGRMLCQAASQMAIKVIILDPMENCPASSLAHYHMVGSYDDGATVQEFAKRLALECNYVLVIQKNLFCTSWAFFMRLLCSNIIV